MEQVIKSDIQANDVFLPPNRSFLMLGGCNGAGKSTLLQSVGLIQVSVPLQVVEVKAESKVCY